MTTLILKKATRIEGNADIHIEFEGDRLKSARFQVLEFRGFEKFAGGRRAEWVPHMISRICGLCSTAHQVAGRIENLLKNISAEESPQKPDWQAIGQGIGALEAPRGLLIHKYRVNRGYVDKIRLLVATQFNNAFINLLITDLAQRHSRNGRLTDRGNRLIGRCIHLLDPCLSCATH